MPHSHLIPAEGHPRRLVARRQRLHQQLDHFLDQLAQTGIPIQGQAVEAMEQAVLATWGRETTTACVAMSSGSLALQAVLECLHLPAGGQVITTPYTFAATWLACSRTLTVQSDGRLVNGLTVVCADIDPHTYTLDPDAVEAAITEHTVAIVPVHMHGLMADMRPLLALAERYSDLLGHPMYVIEDACQAHGATYTDPVSRQVFTAGTMGHVGVLSLNAVKNMGGIDSDGGLVLVNQEAVRHQPAIVADLRAYVNYGRTTAHRYRHPKLGARARLGELNAREIGAELRLLDGWNRERQRIAERFTQACAHSTFGLRAPCVPAERTHVYFSYVVRAPTLDAKVALEQRMRDARIAVADTYPLVWEQEPYRRDWFPWLLGSTAVAERETSLLTHVPLYPELTEEEVRRIEEVLAS